MANFTSNSTSEGFAERWKNFNEDQTVNNTGEAFNAEGDAEGAVDEPSVTEEEKTEL